MNLMDKIIAYEEGTLVSNGDVVEFFQELIDTGFIWQLQGCYCRTANQLIENGYCFAKK